MGTPTPPGTPAVLPDAHSASINTNRDEFDFQSSFPSLQVKHFNFYKIKIMKMLTYNTLT